MEAAAALRLLVAEFAALDLVAPGVAAVAFVMFAERFVMVVPSPILLSGLGLLAAQGGFDPLACFLASVAGSFAGASVWYAGGRGLLTYRRVRRPGWPRFEPPAAWRDAVASRAGGAALATIASQCVPTLRLLAPMAAGLGRADWLRQAPFLLVGCAIWNGLFFFLGWRAGAQ